jgi:hypothetical protein
MKAKEPVNQQQKEADKKKFKELDRRARDIEKEKGRILERDGYKEKSSFLPWLLIIIVIIAAAIYFFLKTR